MGRKVALFAILLMIVLIWTSGCSMLSPGIQNDGGYNPVRETQRVQPYTTSVVTQGTTVPVYTVKYTEHVSCERILACYPPAVGLVKDDIQCYEGSPRSGDIPATLTSLVNYGHYDEFGLFRSEVLCQASDTATYVPEEFIVKDLGNTYGEADIPIRIQGYPGEEYITTIGKGKSHNFLAVVHSRFIVSCGADATDTDPGRERGLQYVNSFDFRCLEALG
jgi:hypothetical protein